MRAAAALLAAASLVAAAPPGPFDRIAAGESASAVLGDWCAAHRLPPLRADRLPTRKVPDAAVEATLGRGAHIAYRRVRLACGRQTLSTADNWYLPGRLSPGMGRRLDTTDAPFGMVVRPLAFHRRTLAAAPDGRGHFVVRAVLVDRAGSPFSYVVERYAALSR